MQVFNFVTPVGVTKLKTTKIKLSGLREDLPKIVSHKKAIR